MHVLSSVDFTARAGEVTALVGDNGAGKSTLVKCIGGIYPVDAGELIYDGTPGSVHGPRDAAPLGIEIVYQDLALATTSTSSRTCSSAARSDPAAHPGREHDGICSQIS